MSTDEAVFKARIRDTLTGAAQIDSDDLDPLTDAVLKLILDTYGPPW